jgi:hypothetical protein
MRRSLAAGIVLAAIAVAVAAGIADARTSSLVGYRRTHGTETLIVNVAANGAASASYSDSIRKLHRSARFRLGPGALGRLRHQIRVADLATLKSSYPSPPGFVCGTEQRVRAAGRTVSAGSGGAAPARLRALLDALDRLGDRHTGASARAAIC